MILTRNEPQRTCALELKRLLVDQLPNLPLLQRIADVGLVLEGKHHLVRGNHLTLLIPHVIEEGGLQRLLDRDPLPRVYSSFHPFADTERKHGVQQLNRLGRGRGQQRFVGLGWNGLQVQQKLRITQLAHAVLSSSDPRPFLQCPREMACL